MSVSQHPKVLGELPVLVLELKEMNCCELQGGYDESTSAASRQQT
jgi:hypothetical protein